MCIKYWCLSCILRIFNCSDIHFRIVFLLLVFFLFAFAEELPTTAFGLILTNDLDISPSTQTWYYTAAFTTFSFQPLFAVIVQFLSLYTCLKQKFFAILGIVIGGAMYIVIGSTKPNFGYLFVFTIILNIGLAICNAIIDGISVEISNYFKQQQQTNKKHLLKQQFLQKNNNKNVQNNNIKQTESKKNKLFDFGSAASVQSLSYFFRSCGSLSSSAMIIGLNALDSYGIITLTGIIYLCIVLPFLLLLFPRSSVNIQHQSKNENDDNNKKEQKMSIKNELMKYWNIIMQIWRCLIFVFLLNVPPSITDVFYTFIYSRSYFSNQQYRLFKFESLIGASLGGLIYFLFLAKHCKHKRYLFAIFIIMQILNCLFGASFIPLSLLSDKFINDSSLQPIFGIIPINIYIAIMLIFDTMTSSLVLMPQLTLAAQMSPLKLETSVFACFIGISHLGALISAAISSALLKILNISQTNWNNLTIYIIICSASGLLPLFALVCLKTVKTDDVDVDVEDEEEDEGVIKSDNKMCSKIASISENNTVSLQPYDVDSD